MPGRKSPASILRALNPPPQLHPLGVMTVPPVAPTAVPRSILAAFPDPRPERDYEIQFVFPEFTSVCPVTGQPDFATITVRYVPDRLCVEMKSLKLYFFAYRNKRNFYEAVVMTILDDLVEGSKPRRVTVVVDFAARARTAGTLIATYPHR